MAFPRRSSRPSRSSRSRYTLGLLLLTAFTLLVVDLPGTGPLRPVRNALASAFSPVRAAGDAVFEPFRNGWKGAFGYEDVKEENERLRARLEEAKGDDAELEQLRREVAELEKLNGVTVESVRTKTARVVSDPISNFDNTIEIDQGSGDGVKVGMAVVTGLTEGSNGGVLGRIVTVQGGRSKVELVTDPNFNVGIRLEAGRAGVLQGQGHDKPALVENIPTDIEVAEGDLVSTSGITETAFPADLVIGRVSAVRPSANGFDQTLEVEPLADLDSVYVKVVLKDRPR